MPIDLDALLAPATCALITQECQNGVIGAQSSLPALAKAARNGMIDAISDLLRAARTAGVSIVHCTAERRRDGRGHLLAKEEGVDHCVDGQVEVVDSVHAC